MNEKLYDMMDWARIEALVYSEEDQPHSILGQQKTSEGMLIQAFFPEASSVEVVTDSKTIPMDDEDDGFFAALLPGRRPVHYQLKVTGKDGSVEQFEDAYAYNCPVDERVIEEFNAGIAYDIYETLGAHPMTVDGTEGVRFAVWAPNAVRVSVVGDFNNWDGRRLPMERQGSSGIFTLFVPGVQTGDLYKYEVKAKGGLTFLKADPYAFASQLRPDSASVVARVDTYPWKDEPWLSKRSAAAAEPLCIYEVSLDAYRTGEENSDLLNYRALAPQIAEHVKRMGYTHIQLMPVMEYPHDETAGYQTSGFYAPTARYGSPEDFMYFVDYMHQQGLGVILDFVPAHFPRDTFSLCGFDGTCLYEHQDPRRGVQPLWNTLCFNFGRPQVRNFLIASALFWTGVYHADGLSLSCLSSMLYLDYGRQETGWVANMYGGNEDLDAIELLKHLNSIYKKKFPDALLIAQEESSWPNVTAPLDEGGLGFDYKTNSGWQEDFTSYMQLDPIFRGQHHHELTFSMVYQYSEHYLMALSHDAVSEGKGSLYEQMPGRAALKAANLRAGFGLMMVHPGRKLLFMGEDSAVTQAWKAGCAYPAEGDDESARPMQQYLKDLISEYRTRPALHELDDDPDGFEWINSISANENMLVFLRRTHKEEETMLVVLNFSALPYTNHKIGVPFPGRYKEVFNSDKPEYGGEDHVNPRVKISRPDECDGREDSIKITVPPLGISLFTCTRTAAGASENTKAKNRRSAKSSTVSKGKTTAAKSKARESLKDTLARKVEQEGRA